MAGTLFIVATPIGNLEDVTFRALRTLREVDLIAAEDTRRTAKLLAHYEIRTPMMSLHAHNERREAERVLGRLERGQSVALVSDAGTPGISDPGEHLVRLARDRGIKVSAIPGPSSVMAALSTSGLPASEFLFLGFPPRSGSARTQWMDRVKEAKVTVVAFESPHRVGRTLPELASRLVNRQIQIHRELTKLNEEFVIYHNNSSASVAPERGEFVIIIEPLGENEPSPGEKERLISIAIKMFGCMTINDVFERAEAESAVSMATSLDARTVRKAVKEHRILRKRAADGLPNG